MLRLPPAEDEELLRRAVEQGARGFLLEDAPVQELARPSAASSAASS